MQHGSDKEKASWEIESPLLGPHQHLPIPIHAPVWVVLQGLDRLLNIADIPELDLAVISAAGQVVLAVGVYVKVTYQLAMGIFYTVDLTGEEKEWERDGGGRDKRWLDRGEDIRGMEWKADGGGGMTEKQKEVWERETDSLGPHKLVYSQGKSKPLLCLSVKARLNK